MQHSMFSVYRFWWWIYYSRQFSFPVSAADGNQGNKLETSQVEPYIPSLKWHISVMMTFPNEIILNFEIKDFFEGNIF